MRDGASPKRVVEIGEGAALERLAQVPYGRIVFCRHALPAIQPVSHLVNESGVIVRTNLGDHLLGRRHGTVVAYQADALDADRRTGWSVTVTGWTEGVSDLGEEASAWYARLKPWGEGKGDSLIRIRPELVTGFLLLCAVE